MTSKCQNNFIEKPKCSFPSHTSAPVSFAPHIGNWLGQPLQEVTKVKSASDSILSWTIPTFLLTQSKQLLVSPRLSFTWASNQEHLAEKLNRSLHYFTTSINKNVYFLFIGWKVKWAVLADCQIHTFKTSFEYFRTHLFPVWVFLAVGGATQRVRKQDRSEFPLISKCQSTLKGLTAEVH